MSDTPSNMMPLGTQAPDFSLPDTISSTHKSLPDIAGSYATVVMFICNHCPFVKHVNAELVRLANEYLPRGVGFVAISANDADYRAEDGPEQMQRVAAEQGYPFPYLYDESQAVAKAYDAACTPDFFVFDARLQCAYRGQLDASRPGNAKPVNGADVRAALDAIIDGKAVPAAGQIPSMGCNIKWKV